MARSVRVLYVAGYERSGSTLLNNLLGQLPGVFAAGEIRNLWPRAMVANKPCGCGRGLQECPTWRSVLSLLGPMDDASIREMLALRDQLRARRAMPSLLRRNRFARGGAWSRSALNRLERLYVAIAEVSGCGTIVDSSKSPLYGYALGTLPGIELSVIHLVRDPRGVEHSCLARMRNRHPAYRNHSTVRTGLGWTWMNLLVESLFAVKRYPVLRVRYEDFTTSPFRALQPLLSSLTTGTSEALLPPWATSAKERRAVLAPTCTVGGSPHRFDTGQIYLEPDDSWRFGLHWFRRLVSSTVTWPVRRRYDY